MPASLVLHHLAVWREGDVTIVRFGDHRILDELAVGKLGEELSSVADRPNCHKLLLNFAGVEFINSLMLGKLLMLKRKMESKGGRLKLCEAGPEIESILDATRLKSIIEVYDSEIDGIRAFAPPQDASPAINET